MRNDMKADFTAYKSEGDEISLHLNDRHFVREHYKNVDIQLSNGVRMHAEAASVTYEVAPPLVEYRRVFHLQGTLQTGWEVG